MAGTVLCVTTVTLRRQVDEASQLPRPFEDLLVVGIKIPKVFQRYDP